VTALFTSLNAQQEHAPATSSGLARGHWLLVKNLEGNGEHNRVLYVLKSRGMAHSNQIREFLLTDEGIELADVYVGPQGVLTGSARQAQEAKEHADGLSACRSSSSAGSTSSAGASRSKPRRRRCGASTRTRPMRWVAC
jgi:circadian clock protein KaiC